MSLQDNYENLANAIIVQAAKDYKAAYKHYHRRRTPTKEAKRSLEELEAFFRSAWYRTLTSVDGEMLMAKLRKECAE